MSKRNASMNVGMWLTGGGLAILAAHHWLVAYRPQLSTDGLVLLAGALAGYVATALGVFMAVGRARPRRPDDRHAALSEGAERAIQCSSERGDPTLPRTDAAIRGMAGSFLAWCEEQAPEESPWGPFDQLLREMLTERFGAVRIRAYHVLPGDLQLRGLSQSSAGKDARCARTGVLGHVATCGRDYYAADPSHGELIDQLLHDENESWDWVAPILRNGRAAGLLTIGKLPDGALADRTLRDDLRLLLTVFWMHVARMDQLRVAEKTDKGSGLLTRSDFFALAADALADSYRENEPIVAAVLTLEGLRSLDDAGRWSERDELVENIGLLIKRRIRTDDIIGRFSDDRFVLLLRRLDSGLGRLIAVKIQETVAEHIAQRGELGGGLQVRLGLAGSGFERRPLEALLARAFDAVECARKQDQTLYADVSKPTAENTGAAAERECPTS